MWYEYEYYQFGLTIILVLWVHILILVWHDIDIECDEEWPLFLSASNKERQCQGHSVTFPYFPDRNYLFGSCWKSYMQRHMWTKHAYVRVEINTMVEKSWDRVRFPIKRIMLVNKIFNNKFPKTRILRSLLFLYLFRESGE